MPKLLLRCSFAGLITLANIAPANAQVNLPTSVGQIKLPAGSHDTSLHEVTRLFGFPLQIRLFTTTLSVPQLIRFLSRQLPVLRNLHVLKGGALLSGQAHGQSWAVYVQGLAQGGSRATLSVLESSASSHSKTVAPAWIPSQSRLLLDLYSTEGAWLVTEQIWRHASGPSNMRSILQTALRRIGWKRADTVFNGEIWQRRGEELVYSVVALDNGSAVFFRVRHRA